MLVPLVFIVLIILIIVLLFRTNNKQRHQLDRIEEKIDELNKRIKQQS